MSSLRLFRTPRELVAWFVVLLALTVMLPTLWLRVAVLLVGVGLWIVLRLAFDQERA